ncbi:hypothetical protein G9A89_016939 [Geosiphon pyriformis]|nr:hypothetical protein G9A89_016939 [Geosiphon pyriformis]
MSLNFVSFSLIPRKSNNLFFFLFFSTYFALSFTYSTIEAAPFKGLDLNSLKNFDYKTFDIFDLSKDDEKYDCKNRSDNENNQENTNSCIISENNSNNGPDPADDDDASEIFYNDLEAPILVTTEKLLGNLTKFAHYAHAAYCHVDKVSNWQCGEACDSTPGTKLVAIINNRLNTRAVNDQEERIIVSYRGTVRTDIINVWIDLKVIPVKYPGVINAKVHSGFLEGHELMKDDVTKHVQDLLNANPTYTVSITGHSLGGAFSVISALHLRKQITSLIPNKNLFVYTYGQPRVGNDAFAKYVDSQISIYRISHTIDKIPHYPPRWFGYQHTPGELWIKHDAAAITNGTLYCPGIENEHCSDSIKRVDQNVNAHTGPYFGVVMNDC